MDFCLIRVLLNCGVTNLRGAGRMKIAGWFKNCRMQMWGDYFAGEMKNCGVDEKLQGG